MSSFRSLFVVRTIVRVSCTYRTTSHFALRQSLSFLMALSLRALSIVPLLPPLWILCQLLSNDIGRIRGVGNTITKEGAAANATKSSVGAQLLVFLALGILGHVGTHRLIPSIKYYMLKRGICGKDLGKKGTKSENDDM